MQAVVLVLLLLIILLVVFLTKKPNEGKLCGAKPSKAKTQLTLLVILRDSVCLL